MTSLILPDIALSVRQPWAWAIVMGFKPVENRNGHSIALGRMTPGKIAIHASKGMTRDEYEEAAVFMASMGVSCPPPAALIRGAIIGGTTVTEIVTSMDSRWFFGPRGLLLANSFAVDPIPAKGELGYFKWKQGGEIDQPSPWMTAWPGDFAPGRKTITGKRVAAAPLFDKEPK
ncbi:MAG: hypothetical protein WC722_05880 [Rhodospirillales bacterium]|jgi:hypothetical protein